MQPSQQSNTLGNASLALGIASMAIAGLFTAVSLFALLTGRIDALEKSRAINLSYALLSTCGEGIAIAGIVIGIAALFKKDRRKLTAIVGLALNTLGACLFLPATAAVVFNWVVRLIG